MGRLNGADALIKLGMVLEAVEGIKVDVSDLKDDVHSVRTDVAVLKANQKPRRRLPPWIVVRFVAAAIFALSAGVMKVPPKWVDQVLSSMR
jgi:hypothetical protein